MTSKVRAPASPSRIVVRGTNWVGDTVMSVPAIKELRRIFPSTKITLWVPSGLAPLVSATGVPDDVICFDGNSGGPMQRPFRMRGKLNSGNFDMSVLLQNAFESAFSSWLAGIPLRAGYPTDLRGPLLNIKIPLTRQIRAKHQVFYYLAITRFLEVYFRDRDNSPEGFPDCSIPIKEENYIRARDLIASRGAGLDRPIFCLCPGSVNSEAKRWPGQSFARLADLLIDRIGAQVVFLGAPQEEGLVEGIMSIMRNSGALNIVGADMMTSMAVMNLSALVISNDTGSAHLAVASSARVLTIFGPTNPGATAPYGASVHVIQGNAPCAPCRHFRCPLPEHPCMSSVEPEAVLRKAEEILSGFPRARE
jgi:heptosyltransferase-2